MRNYTWKWVWGRTALLDIVGVRIEIDPQAVHHPDDAPNRLPLAKKDLSRPLHFMRFNPFIYRPFYTAYDLLP